MARKLTAKGIDHMRASTWAKIETGDREVKLDEAAAVADLFEMSLDELTARDTAKRRQDDLIFSVRQLRDNARKHAGGVADLSWAINADLSNVTLDGIPTEIAEVWRRIEDRAESASHYLDTVAYDLAEVAEDATEILSRHKQDDER